MRSGCTHPGGGFERFLGHPQTCPGGCCCRGSEGCRDFSPRPAKAAGASAPAATASSTGKLLLPKSSCCTGSRTPAQDPKSVALTFFRPAKAAAASAPAATPPSAGKRVLPKSFSSAAAPAPADAEEASPPKKKPSARKPASASKPAAKRTSKVSGTEHHPGAATRALPPAGTNVAILCAHVVCSSAIVSTTTYLQRHSYL